MNLCPSLLALSLGGALSLANLAPALAQEAPDTLGSSAGLELTATAAGTTLSWPDGRSFHTTTAPVRAARHVTVAGSPVRLALWEERPGAGSPIPFYAISLDGRTTATVRQTSYQLLLRRERFDPLAGQPELELLPAAGEVYLVQFLTQPLDVFRTSIEALGGRIGPFVGNHAYVVHMPASVRDAVRELEFVRWVGLFHPEFRLEQALLDGLATGTLPPLRYNVQVFERGAAQKEVVAARIRALGGVTGAPSPDGFLLQADLTAQQLASVATFDEVQFVDRWSPAEDDMDIAREISGANYVESTPATPYTGVGVRVEVLDSGCDTAHPDFAGRFSLHGSVIVGSHGTCTSGIVAGSGAGNFAARGVMPDSHLVSAYYNGMVGSRYTHTAELVNAGLPYKCVLQSNSWGNSRTFDYTTISMEMDDIILINDILITQSQSNSNTQDSRPQAWAKNIVSVGGIRHFGTLGKGDDQWNGASIGPAADGRLKPDLSHFYDGILCTDRLGNSGYSSTDYYSSFGGTSGATPITAGYFGLFYEMWHRGEFGNPTGASVFDSRPHFSLAKAALINTASQYPFTGTGHNLTRVHQGWGLADVKNLYDQRSNVFWVNEEDVLGNLESEVYSIQVQPAEPALRVTMVYRDLPGTTNSGLHRINDLSLKVVSPGGTTYWGNNGLNAGVWSTTGGSANTIDTVENVFVQNPAAGNWTVEVIASEVNADVSGDPGVNVDFSLWLTGGTENCPQPVSYCTAGVTSSGCQATMGSSGVPSLSNAAPFTLTCSNVEVGKNGLFFYSITGRLAKPWGDSTSFRCIKAPTQRILPPGDSGGTTACTGSYTADWNGYVAANPFKAINQALMTGSVVDAQVWFRDPAAGTGPVSAKGTALSDALEFTLCP